jgi:hypothetical protein
MADDVTFQTTLASPPDQTVVATDDVGGAHYQRIKVDLGGDGAASPLVRGQQADANSLPVTLSTEQAAFLDGLETLLAAIETATEACQAALETAGGLVVNLGANNDVTVTGSVTANAGTNLNTSLLALESGGNLAGAATSLAAIDDWDESDRAKVNIIVGQAGIAGGSGVDGATVPRVTLATNVALPAGTNGIGKLTANSGVDIGDVDVTSIAAGSNLIGNVGIGVRTSGGATAKNSTSSDGSTALTNSAQQIKDTAGQLYGWYIYNPNSTAAFVQFYNTDDASVTVGTTEPLIMFTIPPGAAANQSVPMGITFGTGLSWAATSTAGGNGALTTAIDAVCWYN